MKRLYAAVILRHFADNDINLTMLIFQSHTFVLVKS